MPGLREAPGDVVDVLPVVWEAAPVTPNVRSVRLGTVPPLTQDSGMTPRDWPTRLKGCRTSVTGTLRGVLSFDASGRDTRTLAVIPVLAPLLPALEPERVRLAGSFAAPVAAPPRRRGCSFDCE